MECGLCVVQKLSLLFLLLLSFYPWNSVYEGAKKLTEQIIIVVIMFASADAQTISVFKLCQNYCHVGNTIQMLMH